MTGRKGFVEWGAYGMEPGESKSGKKYDRTLKYPAGMKELVEIVAGLYKDVRRINECITLSGAEAYINKRKLKNWEAAEMDITGPNGKPDGIEEVVVTDAKGNLRVVNGYGLTKGDYPMRKLHRTLLPTKEQRKGNPISALRKRIAETNEDGQYTMNITGLAGNQFAGMQPSQVDLRKFFKQHIFKPIYDTMMQNENMEPIRKAQIFTRAFNTAYREIILAQVFNSLGRDITKMTKSQIASLQKKGDSPFYQTAVDLMNAILSDDEMHNNADQEISGIISDSAPQ